MAFQHSPTNRQLTNKELEQLTNMANNGNIFEKNNNFLINETIKEITIALNLDKEQLKEIDVKYLPIEKNYLINKKRLELLNLKNKTKYSIDVELEILDVESKNVEFETQYFQLKDLRDGLLEEIKRKEKDIQEFKTILEKNSKQKEA